MATLQIETPMPEAWTPTCTVQSAGVILSGKLSICS
jgi:hypothetical protein